MPSVRNLDKWERASSETEGSETEQALETSENTKSPKD